MVPARPFPRFELLDTRVVPLYCIDIIAEKRQNANYAEND
jgi:hypothetical protein